MRDPEPHLGELEQLVLLATLQLGDGAFGGAIAELLAERAGRRVARGAVYTTLDRLEAKRLVRSRMADESAARGGRPRRYFTVTPPALAALRRSRRAVAELSRGLETQLEEGG